MSTLLTLLLIWSIVALVCHCCYRLWYWTPTPTTHQEIIQAEESAPPRAA